MARSTGRHIASAVALLLCAGCAVAGAEDHDGSFAAAGSSAPPSPSGDVVRAPFCDKLDEPTIRSILGERGLRLVEDFEPGELYESAPGSRVTSHSWGCTFANDTPQRQRTVTFRATIRVEQMGQRAFVHEVDEVIRSRRGEGASCTKETATPFVAASLVVKCVNRPSMASSMRTGHSTAGYYALVAGSMVSCDSRAEDARALRHLERAARALCPQVLAAVTRAGSPRP